ncbi:MAG TPA: translocation/assembly module TamB domain-containing protein [Vicinamibacterales bacterium]|nr:translocation/assembly module TamB domain-containing protein [Vicinamibacterales bacterium]
MARLRRVVRVVLGVIVALLIAVGVGLTLLETGWAKNQIRQLIVRQANEYLSATLEIDALGGSLFRGLSLDGVRLSRDGRTLIAIDRVEVSYSIRELLQPGVVIRRVRVVRPRIAGGKEPDGRWDLGTLVKRERREQQRSGPGRPIEVQAIEIVDGDIALRDEVDLGAAHIPTHYAGLNASLAFAYYPVRWQLTFHRIGWIGSAPALTVNELTGVFGRGPTGWFFQDLHVVTAHSTFTVRGRIDTEQHPTNFDLQVTAERFAFQEWGGVLHGLRNIAVDSAFDTSLKGPSTALATTLRLSGSGGGVRGTLTIDTSVPGWRAAGAVDVERLELGHWLNRDDRPSDITGHVTFDLALELGRHFPEGRYTFAGPHAMYMHYAADNLRARGRITPREVQVDEATATAYGAGVTTGPATIGIDAPFPYRFAGRVTGIDLRNVPPEVPVPHVESTLTFDYDVTGRFSEPFIAGGATFAASEFLGAAIGPGTSGTIDTSTTPIHYTGDGELDHLDLHRFGDGLDVAWMRDPRYAGTIAGHFHVDVTGSDRASLVLTGGGRLFDASMFRGRLHDADVSVEIARGTLKATYDGAFAGIDPSIPFANPRAAASLTGSGRVTATVRDLLTSAETTWDDYDVAGTLTLDRSTIRDVALDRASLDAVLRGGTLTLNALDVAGPAVEGHATGTLTFTDPMSLDINYDATRVDLAQLPDMDGRDATGTIATKGRASGPFDALHLAGEASINDLNAYDVQAITLAGPYDVTLGEHPRANATISGSVVTVAGAAFTQANGTVTFDDPTLRFDLRLQRPDERSGRLAGTVAVTRGGDETAIALSDLAVTLGSTPWRLAESSSAPVVRVTGDRVTIPPLSFIAGAGGGGTVGVSGTWQTDGGGALRVTASHVFLETLQNATRAPATYGGVLDADVTIRGTRQQPTVDGTLTISAGRVERVTFQQLAARIGYTNGDAHVDIRLDQSPGVSMTAVGTVPRSLFDAAAPDHPINVTLRSTAIDLGLVEGITAIVRNVTGQARFDVHVVGTGRDPHFQGSFSVASAGFVVSATGARYRNAAAAIGLATDRISVESLHLEDSSGHPLDVHGSLGTHELRVGELEIDADAKQFEILRNELGRISVDVALRLRGRFEQPSVTGDVTISSGELRVDELLSRVLFTPYATEQTEFGPPDPAAALNPWRRLALDFALHVPSTLRLTGTNVQVSPGTPIGIGDINLRVGGDLYFYKGSGERLWLSGSLDSVSGMYSFQGRRFTVDEQASSINFRGDPEPEVYVAVTRDINGIDARVTISGTLDKPELQLSSVPPLDATDILSLIVFNMAPNQLNTAQQQELVVRAGALAAGFLATPLVSAIQQEIGLQVLDIEPSTDFTNAGPRVTVGQELLPGLVAEFSRQFGQEPYDQATIEYYLSRILRLRATFSDAQSLMVSPFRRIERAGIDLLFFFSF